MNKRTWIIFFFLSVLSIAAWIAFSYPQFEAIDFSIDRAKAAKIAENYLLTSQHIQVHDYRKAAVFITDTEANRYLQKTLGFKKEQAFLKEHDYDLFLWLIRYFKENEKEEIRLTVSVSTGEITSFQHAIDDTSARDIADDETAKKTAADFLKERFGFDFQGYSFYSKQSHKFDNRVDHAFTWQKNGINLPWDKDFSLGTAKLLTGATVSGHDILSFAKNRLDIPEKFSRLVQKILHVGQNLSLIFTIVYIGLVMVATYFVILRRHHLAMHVAKRPYIVLTIILFLSSLVYAANEFESTIFNYDTTTTFHSYFFNFLLNLFVSAFLAITPILMPALTGESLSHEIAQTRQSRSLLPLFVAHPATRSTAKAIFLGYFVFVILLGIQSVIFEIGHRYLGVWVEHGFLTKISTSYFPFLSVFIISFQASIIEEIIYRLFAINFFFKITKNIVWAALLSSAIWGFGHSHYLVFPMWFRGLEVTCLGIFLSYIYLRYGIVTVIVAHFAFDAFWYGAGFLLGKTSIFHFVSTLAVLLLPMVLGIVSYLMNRPSKEPALRWQFTAPQQFNLQVLLAYLKGRPARFNEKTNDEIRNELIAHNWDAVVVDEAMKDLPTK